MEESLVEMNSIIGFNFVHKRVAIPILLQNFFKILPIRTVEEGNQWGTSRIASLLNLI
jgi:hypothetical protein